MVRRISNPAIEPDVDVILDLDRTTGGAVRFAGEDEDGEHWNIYARKTAQDGKFAKAKIVRLTLTVVE